MNRYLRMKNICVKPFAMQWKDIEITYVLLVMRLLLLLNIIIINYFLLIFYHSCNGYIYRMNVFNNCQLRYVYYTIYIEEFIA